jgi:hypothetical protein
MTDAANPLMPGSPADFGVSEPELRIEQVEPARELGNDAREHLREAGFSDTQIDDWADAFIARTGEGSVGELVAWIGDQQNAASGG